MTTLTWRLLGPLLLFSAFHTMAQCPESIQTSGNDRLRLTFSSVPDPIPTSYTFMGVNYPINQSGSSGNFTSENGAYPQDNLDISITLNYSGTNDGCSYDASGSLQAPTPVELSLFTGKLIGNNAELTWLTESESDNAGFEIEQSFDGSNFTTISMINGIGYSTTVQNYTFTDRGIRNRALGTQSYYRLAQIDFDGTKSYSDVITVDLELELEALAITKVVGWNTPEKKITLYFNCTIETRKINFLLSNMNGDIIDRRSIYPEHGLNCIELDLSDQKSALYFAYLDDGKTIATEKISLVSNY